MTRIHLIAVLGLFVAVPAAAAASFMFENRQTAPQPCFAASNGPYRLSTGAADYTVRIDNAAAEPALRLQIVDDPTIADFVLVDDGADTCAGAGARSVRIDNQAAEPDLVIAVSDAPAQTKIYVKSAVFSAEAAAALFAVSAKTAPRNLAARAVAR